MGSLIACGDCRFFRAGHCHARPPVFLGRIEAEKVCGRWDDAYDRWGYPEVDAGQTGCALGRLRNQELSEVCDG